MKLSVGGLSLIRRFEGLEPEAYQDIAGVWTIGYGHTGPEVRAGLQWSEQVAEAALTQDVEWAVDAINRLVAVPLNQHEFDALVSFVFNVGVRAFESSTALKRLNRGDRAGAAEALTWWNKAKVDGVLRPVEGLTRRRAAERDLFLTPVGPAEEAGEDEGCVVAPGKCEEVSVTGPEPLRNSRSFLKGLLCGKS